jgi:WD40 repeat protein
MPSGELMSMTRPKGQVVNALLFSPDGTTLAVSVDRGEYGERHGPGTAELWRVEPGARLSRERSWEVPENYVAGVIFRSDGRILAVTVLRTAYDRFIRLWDIDTGARYQLPIKESCSDSIAPSPDGTTLAVTFECFGWEGVPPTSIALWKLEESPR